MDEEGFMMEIERFTKQEIPVQVHRRLRPRRRKAEPIAMGRQTIWGGAGKPPSRDVMQAAAKAARQEMMERIRTNKVAQGGDRAAGRARAPVPPQVARVPRHRTASAARHSNGSNRRGNDQARAPRPEFAGEGDAQQRRSGQGFNRSRQRPSRDNPRADAPRSDFPATSNAHRAANPSARSATATKARAGLTTNPRANAHLGTQWA
jgi:ATP-dependent RNA helicase RhlE